MWAPGRRLLTTGLVLTITLAAFEALAIATVMPVVEEDLGDLALYGWVFSGFFLGNLVGIVATGILADRRSPALPFAVGLGLFALGLVAGGLAGSMPVLVAARVVQGIGAGAIPASAYASVGRGYPPSLRPRAFAIMSTAWVVPAVLGPPLAAVVEHAFTWRAVFLGLLPLVAVAAVITVPSLLRLGPGAGSGDRPAGDAARMGFVALLVTGAGATFAAGQAPPLVAVALVAVGLPVAVASFVHLTPAGTLRLAPGLPVAIAVRGLLTCAFFSADAFVSLAVTEGPAGSTALAGATLAGAALAWSAAAWVQERVIERVGPRRLDRIAFGLLAGATSAMVAVVLALPAWAALLPWAVAGFAMGLGMPALSVTALGSATPGREGYASSALQLCDTLGVAVGTGLAGLIIGFGDGRGWEVSSGVSLVFVLAVVVSFLGARASRRLPVTVPGN